jgi:2-oxoglutarate dehydrogenase E1 component
MNIWREFQGVNAGYVLELYERYQRDPRSVDPATRAMFERWKPEPDGALPALAPAIDKIVGVVNLAQAIRSYGHLEAQLDPLGSQPPGDPALQLEAHGLTEADLRHGSADLVGGPLAEGVANTLDAIQGLRKVYSSTIGYDYDHIRVPEERDWLRHAAESGSFRPPEDPIDPLALLERLTKVEVFEQFLNRIFPGKSRFSLEGLDMLIPILDEVVGAAAEADIHNILIGMAHRGRLNVLAHVLTKPYAQILAEFKDPVRPHSFREDSGWTGDVKYHMGARRAIKDGTPIDLVITMPANPSHVEAINPVVEGMARAAGTRVDHPGPPRFDPSITLPILIHGDAAFPGQGGVAETLNLYRLPGYRTGGTLHIIANNQLGYTTNPDDYRSTLYASDLAKGFKIPIVHVNADDPEAGIEVARLAFAYRARFQKDFVIDLIGYRRQGHNEGDEPSFTQPLMYAKIETHPTVREQWAKILQDRGILDERRADELVRAQMEELHTVLESLRPEEDLIEPIPEPPPPGAARRVKTTTSVEFLKELSEALLQVPEGFTLHRKLERAMQRRRKLLDTLDEPTLDWATAEGLAFASILAEGIAIRLTGEDVERGTFSQRHAVFHDVKTGETFTPLQALPQAKAAFEIHDSPLTENATVGFEYGYNVQEPGRLVIWEAQYGDFINGAQVMIDEFLVSARAKWGQTPSLVLLLPHGYEGHGPDHSSARLERFLELAADNNMRIADCTTAAQYFHLLRRQAALLQTDPLPLVILTPKGLLRHPLVAASLRELAEGGWQPVIVSRSSDAEPVRRVICCHGKIYVDLVTSNLWDESSAVAIARVEQLYPFPTDDLQHVFDGFSHLTEVVWAQEEPENMGAWARLRPRLSKIIGGRWPLYFVGRPASSSPAEGSMAWHTLNQKALIKRAFDLELHVGEDDRVLLERV